MTLQDVHQGRGLQVPQRHVRVATACQQKTAANSQTLDGVLVVFQHRLMAVAHDMNPVISAAANYVPAP